MGAEIEWEAIGKDSFLITVNVYRDCNGIGLGTSTINITNNCGTTQLSPTTTLIGDVTPVCNAQNTRCDGSSVTFKYGVQKYELKALYVATNDITNGCCETTISWGQCCRSLGITTGASNQNFYLDSKMNACLGKSSPKWSTPAINIGCLGRDQLINNGVVSNDSLVYSCTSPLQSATQRTSWKSGYSECAPLKYLGFPRSSSKPPFGFHLDGSTGEMLFRPMSEEQTVIATRVEIYDKGKMIGYIKRDAQYIVLKCPNNSPPVLSGVNASVPKPENFKTTVCAGKQLCFSITTSDKDKGDTVTLGHNHAIANAQLTITNAGAAKEEGEFCWKPGIEDVRSFPHRVIVSATDNACPIASSTVRTYSITVVKPYTLDLDVLMIADKCGAYHLMVQDKNGRSIDDAKWYENDTTYLGEGDSLYHIFSSAGSRKIAVKVNDCLSQSKDTVLNVPAVNTLKLNLDDEVVCHNKVLRLQPTAIGAQGKLSYQWTLDHRLVYTGRKDSNHVDLSFTNAFAPENYQVSVVGQDSLGCADTAAIEVRSKNNLPTHLENDRSICEDSNSPIALKLVNGQGQWSGAGISNNLLHLDSLIPGTNYLLTYHFEDSLSCFSDSLEVDYRALPQLNIGSDFTSCTSSPNVIQLSTPTTQGIWSGTGISAHTFQPLASGKGSFYLKYRYTDSVGCTFHDSILATVYDYKPTISLPHLLESCDNSTSASLSAQPTNGNWTGPGISGFANPVTINPKQLGKGDFNYVYTYTDSNTCSNTDSTVLRVAEAPKAGFQVIDSTVLQGDSVRINNQTKGSAHLEYRWMIGNPAFLLSHAPHFNEPMDSVDTFDVLLVARDSITGCTDSFKSIEAITVSVNTGIEDFSQHFRVYPNPTKGLLKIKTQNAERMHIKIVSTAGKIVYNGQVKRGADSIDITSLETGLYLLQITWKEHHYTQLLLKQ